MATDVQRYLDAHPAHCEYFEHWEIQGKLQIRLSLAEELPPASVSSSIMSIVLNRDRQVLYLIPSDLKGVSLTSSQAGVPMRGKPRKRRPFVKWPKKPDGE